MSTTRKVLSQGTHCDVDGGVSWTCGGVGVVKNEALSGLGKVPMFTSRGSHVDRQARMGRLSVVNEGPQRRSVSSAEMDKPSLALADARGGGGISDLLLRGERRGDQVDLAAIGGTQGCDRGVLRDDAMGSRDDAEVEDQARRGRTADGSAILQTGQGRRSPTGSIPGTSKAITLTPFFYPVLPGVPLLPPPAMGAAPFSPSLWYFAPAGLPYPCVQPRQPQQQRQAVPPMETHFDVTNSVPTPRKRKVVVPPRKARKRKTKQRLCCVEACTRRMSKRNRKSMRMSSKGDFKDRYVRAGWLNICNYHYFSSLYLYKKLTGQRVVSNRKRRGKGSKK